MTDPALATVVAGEISVPQSNYHGVNIKAPAIVIRDGDDYGYFNLLVDRSPVSLAMKVSIRDSTRTERPVSPVLIRRGVRHDHGLNVRRSDLLAFPSNVVDVVLRPDPDAAVKTVDMDAIWGEVIVIPNVHIIRTPGRE